MLCVPDASTLFKSSAISRVVNSETTVSITTMNEDGDCAVADGRWRKEEESAQRQWGPHGCSDGGSGDKVAGSDLNN